MRTKNENGMWQSFREGPYYRPSLVSVGMHLTFLVLLSINWLWAPTHQMSSTQPPVEIIQAQAINEQTYNREVQKIEQAQKREQQRVAEEKRKAAEAIAKQEAVKKQAIVEEQRKVAAAAKQVEIAKQKEAEALKQQKIAEQKKIEDEKLKAAAEEKRKVEEAAKQQAEAQKKVEEEKQKALEEKRKAEEAAQQQADAQRKAEEDRLRQEQLAAEQQALAAEQQSFVNSELSRYESLIQQKIASVWAVPLGADPNQQVRLAVRLAPDGTVLSATVTQSSGNSALDQSAVTAVLRASPLPVATDPAVFQEMRELDIILTPQSVL